MKKILSLALAAQLLMLVPTVAQAQYQHRHHHGRGGNGMGQLLTGILLGAGAMIAINQLTSRDRGLVYSGANDCFAQAGSCGAGYARPLADQPGFVTYSQRGSDMYYPGRPERCGSVQVLVIDRRTNRVVDQQTQVRCQQGFGNNVITPPPAWGRPQVIQNAPPAIRLAPQGPIGGPVIVRPPNRPIGPIAPQRIPIQPQQQRFGPAPAILPPSQGFR